MDFKDSRRGLRAVKSSPTTFWRCYFVEMFYKV